MASGQQAGAVNAAGMNLAEVSAAAAAFELPAPVVSVSLLGSGHIHQTYRVHTPAGDGVLQRLNEQVFPDLEAITENMRRIEAHFVSGGGLARAALRLRPTLAGGFLHRDALGQAWRMLDFIPGTISHDIAPSLKHIEQAARAFGEFQRALDTLPGPPLKETLPGFHDTEQRFLHFQVALAKDAAGRLQGCREEVEVLLAQRHLAGALQARNLPRRTVHNDTKLNNLLFLASTGERWGVIDWDTVMPGLVAHDYGDMVRTMGSEVAEDERDLSRVRLMPERLKAIRRGYLSAVEDWLTPAELDSLSLGAETILFEQAVRFLADHLAGDLYYPCHRPDHNLDRARVQLGLLQSWQQR